MSISYVSSGVTVNTQATTGSTSTVDISMTKGDSIVLFGTGSGASLPSNEVSDNANNAWWSGTGRVSVDNQWGQAWWTRARKTGIYKVTVRHSTSPDHRQLFYATYSGQYSDNPLDVEKSNTQSTPGTASDDITSGAFTTLTANTMVVACCMDTHGNSLPALGSGGYTSRLTSTDIMGARIAEHSFSSIQTGIAATFGDAALGSTDNYIVCVVVLKEGTEPADMNPIFLIPTVSNPRDWVPIGNVSGGLGVKH